MTNRYFQQTGLTLIELLVSLVLLGFLVTIMSGVFFQISKIQNIAENANSDFQQQWVKIGVLRNLVPYLVMPDGDSKPFTGSSDSFQGYALSSPLEDSGSVSKFELQIRKSDTGGSDIVFVTDANKDGTVISRWDDVVEFQYIAGEDEVEAMWPSTLHFKELLPKAVILRSVQSGRIVSLGMYEGARAPEPNIKDAIDKLFGSVRNK